MPAVNLETELAYENICMIIDEFEKTALNSGTRAGILAVSNAPLEALDTILAAKEDVLTRVQDLRNSLSDSAERLDPFQALQSQGPVDVDLMELFGTGDNPVSNYIEECIDCNFRLKFDWQLKPMSLINPVNDLLDQIETSIGQFNLRINPTNVYSDFCNVMNELDSVCIPDLILMLMSFKVTQKRYVASSLDLKLDWTVLVGPIISTIVDGITSLLENAMNIMLSPLDCTLAGMRVANQIQKEASALTALPVVQMQENTQVDANVLNVEPKQIPTGFNYKTDMSLEEALSDPAFDLSTTLDKLLIPLQDFENWIKELFDNILSSLNNLKNLIGGSLGFQLDVSGVLLFISDMINLVMTIIQLRRSNTNVTDWCSFLEQNPQVLAEQLQARLGDVVVEEREETLIILQGPSILGEVPVCSSARTQADQTAIDLWLTQAGFKKD